MTAHLTIRRRPTYRSILVQHVQKKKRCRRKASCPVRLMAVPPLRFFFNVNTVAAFTLVSECICVVSQYFPGIAVDRMHI